jgi:hypothetical protein
MCIPIDLNVPVLGADGREVGTAHEILCAGPHEGEPGHGPDLTLPTPIRRLAPSDDDLWLRVTRPLGLPLYVPFAEIAETRADGVRLRVPADEVERRDWDDAPAALPAERTVALRYAVAEARR